MAPVEECGEAEGVGSHLLWEECSRADALHEECSEAEGLQPHLVCEECSVAGALVGFRPHLLFEEWPGEQHVGQWVQSGLEQVLWAVSAVNLSPPVAKASL